ncbi:hypothetical protein [Actinomycetospora chibensis]|uniref:Uncharacterized protein n=1 Tax=Actinomycetospora chibensis TaxID=663606 RepID=A0ABV9REL1_9PSEU|nr:hypothetical protein [Actinomycetospora chibensis]MDD7923965.1 hypothetical protein [Actinomycetospora chibensis]
MPQPPESVPPRRAGRGRRHDTFAVLGRARTALDRAELALDRAYERTVHASSAPSRRQAPPAPDAATRSLLRRRLG